MHRHATSSLLRAAIGLALLLAFTLPVHAGDEPLTAHNKKVYNGASKIILRAAELMPADKYDYRPTDSVRTFAQMLGHIADSQYAFCARVLGEPQPRPQVEKNMSGKKAHRCAERCHHLLLAFVRRLVP